MLWAVIGVAVVVLAVASRGFRKVLAALGIVALVAAAGLYAYWNHQDRQRARETAAAKTRTPREKIELSEMRMGVTGNLNSISGRLKNNDLRYTVTAVELKLDVTDCAGIDALRKCEIVGTDTETLMTAVPPNQSREVTGTTYFPGLGKQRPGFERNWSYEVLSVSSEP